MKHILNLLMIFVAIATELSAAALTRDLNGARIGDCIEAHKIKCDFNKVFSDTSVYDFSSCAIGEKYSVKYSAYKDTLMAVCENRCVTIIDHRTATTFTHAYRKPGLNLKFIRPEIVMGYSLEAGDGIEQYFYCEGIDGTSGYVRHAGKSNVSTSLSVSIITPDGEVFDNVVSVTYCRTASTILSHIFPQKYMRGIDNESLSNDSIDKYNATDSITHIVKHRYWYAPGYRYPIIEVRQYNDYFCGVEIDSAYMALYYSPVSQETDIKNDPLNESIRADMKFRETKNISAQNTRGVLTKAGVPIGILSQNSNSTQPVESSETTITRTIGDESCYIYPQIVTDKTFVNYTTKNGNDAEIKVFTASGVLQSKGNYATLDEVGVIEYQLDTLLPGEYIMYCRIGNNNYSFKILKK